METNEASTPPAPIVPDVAALRRDPAFIEFAIQALGDSELTEGFTPDQLAQLAAIGQVRQYDGGQLVCDEHERTDEMYLIESGALEIWLDPSSIGDQTSAPRKIATLQSGQTCGELALLDGGVRSARVLAGPGGARATAFTRKDLLALCETDTAIGYRLMRNLASALSLRMRLQDMRLYSSE